MIVQADRSSAHEPAHHFWNRRRLYSGGALVAGDGIAARECVVGTRDPDQLDSTRLTVLAGQTWNRWLDHVSIFHLKDHFSDWSSALIIYLFSTFVYFWWHRYRHESQFLWRTLHQIHHSARRLEIVTSFYKHPLEIWINSVLSTLIVYPLFGGSIRAAGYYTVLIAVGEFFYHWNIKTPAARFYFPTARIASRAS